MKKLFYIAALALLILGSCQSIRVAADYDTAIDFNQYKTFAFHKASIDKVEISDLDKRRILNAIDSTLTQKGFIKSQAPDILISIATKATEKVYVNQMNYGWGWGMGWNPYYFGSPNFSNVSTVIEGLLFIDIIDTKTQNLIWQGKGQGVLSENPHEKEKRIKDFVTQILAQYPPNTSKK